MITVKYNSKVGQDHTDGYVKTLLCVELFERQASADTVIIVHTDGRQRCRININNSAKQFTQDQQVSVYTLLVDPESENVVSKDHVNKLF